MTELDTFGCIGATLKTASGKYIDLADPNPASIEIDSIAGALSKICRFGGHIPGDHLYSVAEHCVHAVSLATEDGIRGECLLAILLHDAAEAFLGDMVKPLKNLMPQFVAMESRMNAAIEQAFGVSFEKFAPTIRHYDRTMLKAEKEFLWPESKEQWEGFCDLPNRSVRLQLCKPDEARRLYLGAFAWIQSHGDGNEG